MMARSRGAILSGAWVGDGGGRRSRARVWKAAMKETGGRWWRPTGGWWCGCGDGDDGGQSEMHKKREEKAG